MFGLFRKKKNNTIQRYLKEGAQLLDVRSAAEFNRGSIKDSVHIPLSSLDTKLEKLDPNKPIVTFCAMGGRSTIAAAQLRSKGYRVVDAGSISSVQRQLNRS